MISGNSLGEDLVDKEQRFFKALSSSSSSLVSALVILGDLSWCSGDGAGGLFRTLSDLWHPRVCQMEFQMQTMCGVFLLAKLTGPGGI